MPTRAVTLEELTRLTGKEIGVSDWSTIDQNRIDAFAQATDDHQWIHVDRARAKTESKYGRTIAHGFLTLSLLSRLSNEAVEVRGDFGMRINYGLNRVRFPSPVPEGSRIRARLALQELKEFDGGHQITWLVTVDVEGSDKPALVAEWLIRLYR
jgi:acyl dehydratase